MLVEIFGKQYAVGLDMMMREFMYDHGVKVDDDGFCWLTEKQVSTFSYIHESISRPGVRTWCVPSIFGLTLLYEGEHWAVIGRNKLCRVATKDEL